jgi:hypothetical protein
MDSTNVNKAIRVEIWPALRDIGFETSVGRTAWRHVGDRIHVVNFQSFNSHNAEVIGCTTYSFAVNVGCFLLTIPDLWGRLVSKHGLPLPKEYECPFRGQLFRSLDQPELARRDIWYIDPAGAYLQKSLHDVRMSLLTAGQKWFQRLNDDIEVLRILEHEPEEMSVLWGFGNNPSPIRSYFLGYVASASGRTELAREHLERVAGSAVFERIRPQVEATLASLRLAG